MKKICIFCGSSMGFNPIYKEKAAELGRVLADHGCELLYGGGSVGLMKIIADVMMERHCKVTGTITQHLLDMRVGHPEISELIVVETMAERKKILEDMASIIEGFRVYSSNQIVKADEQKAALMGGYESIRQAFSKNEDAIREQTAQIVEQLVKNNQLADRVQEERENGKDWNTLLKDLSEIKEEIRKSGSNQFQLVNVNL